MSAGYRPYRIELRGTLVPSTAFHVGSGQNFHTSSDSPLLRETNDPAGRLYLPGSSLRGVLRGQLEREKELLGCTEGHIGSFFGMGGDENSTYGRFQVSNAYPTSSEAELRDHVRINNQWGAADSGAKFDLETGFAKEFRYEAVYEGDSANDPEMRLFHEALRHMQSDGFRVGAKSAWGLGRMRLQPDFEVLEFDRSTDEGLIAFLNWRLNEIKPASGLPKNTTVAPLPAPKAWSTITLTLELHFEGPVLVKSAIPASANPGHSDPNDPSTYWTRAVANADGTFVTTIDPLQNKYYLPGSSLRGVLRHEAMWISATKHDDEVNLLFGTANEKGGGSAETIFAIT